MLISESHPHGSARAPVHWGWRFSAVLVTDDWWGGGSSGVDGLKRIEEAARHDKKVKADAAGEGGDFATHHSTTSAGSSIGRWGIPEGRAAQSLSCMDHPCWLSAAKAGPEEAQQLMVGISGEELIQLS